MMSKIERAASARNQIQKQGGDFVVCARTDARSVTGLDNAIQRAIAYAEVGADMIFPAGLNNVNEFKLFAEAIEPHRLNSNNNNNDLFLLANMTEFGTTDIISVSEFK